MPQPVRGLTTPMPVTGAEGPMTPLEGTRDAVENLRLPQPPLLPPPWHTPARAALQEQARARVISISAHSPNP
jgi:hypothetical protein